MVFLNLVVKKIIPDTVQEFMRAWLRQECRDFRIVFIDRDLDQEQKDALAGALRFVEALSLKQMACVVEDSADAPESQMVKTLDSTSSMPKDKMEVLRLRAQARLPKRISLEETKPTTQNTKDLVANASKNAGVKPLSMSASKSKTVVRAKTSEKVFFKIIVPNYNNIAYIKKCLDGILQQTFQDFKIVIVDDMSTDGSDALARAYARMHSAKVVFKSQKRKLYAGGCRNVGIDCQIASEYTVFIDSDDWLYEKTSLEKLHAVAVKSHPKMIRAPMLQYFGDGSRCNYPDRFTSVDKEYMFRAGPGPGRTIVRSDVCQHFVPDRAKSNDVVWFLRCIDQCGGENDIVNAKDVWYVYNRISATSCQNNPEKMIAKKCVDDQLAVADDLQKEHFTTKICQQLARSKIASVKLLYKPHMTVGKCMENARVISIDKDHLQMFNQLFKKHGLLPLPSLHHGCTSKSIPTAQMRCRQSHVDAVSYAKKHGLPWILVFEDDAYPCDNVAQTLERYLYAMPQDANLILLGWCNVARNGQQSFSKPFNPIKTRTLSGSHAYLLFKTGYDQYLNFFTSNPDKYADNDIFLAVDHSYVLNRPLFIQYSASSSMNQHLGYIFRGDHKSPPKNFKPIEEYFK